MLEAEIGDADEEAMEDGRSQASRSQVGLVGTVYTHRRKYSMIKSFSNH